MRADRRTYRPGRPTRARWDVQPFRPLAIVLTVLLAACAEPPTVEQQIIAVMRDMEQRLESAERRPFMNHVAGDFTAQDGAMNRDQFNAMVLYYIHRYKRLQAQLLPIRVNAIGDAAAEARFRVMLTGGERWVPDAGQLYEVKTTWRREEEDWLLVSARWDAVTLDRLMD